jgi:hypothetical protein
MARIYVHYTGIGSHISGLHTKNDFLKIMHNHFPEMIQWRMKGQPPDPTKIKKADIRRWMEFVGAKYVKV